VFSAFRTRCAIAVASLAVLGTPVAYAQEFTASAPLTTAPVSASPSMIAVGAAGPAPAPAPTGTSAASAEATAAPALPDEPAGQGRTRPGRPPVSESPALTLDPGPAPARSASASHSRSVSIPAPDSSPSSPVRPYGRDAVPTRQAPAVTDAERETAAEAADEESGPAWEEPTAARQQPAQAADAATARQISPLSLGTGLTLMGLGVGFLGVRLRRR
jgi:hypothetical protein